MGKVAADEGILSLYKGLLPVIIGSAPEMAVQVSTSWIFAADPARTPSRSESSGYTASRWMIRFTLLCAAFASLHFLLHHHYHHQHHLLLLFLRFDCFLVSWIVATFFLFPSRVT